MMMPTTEPICVTVKVRSRCPMATSSLRVFATHWSICSWVMSVG